MKRNTIGKALIALGILLCIAAAVKFGYNFWLDRHAGDEASRIAQEIETEIKNETEEMPEQPEEDPSVLKRPEGKMPEKAVEGYTYIGTIEIPAQNVNLPVQAEWDDTKSKKSPCRYKGSAYDQNLIIAGHNYKSHFGYIYNLPEGSEVRFTDMNDIVFTYVLKSREIIDMYDVKAMEEGDWDLTLFTCTKNGKSRVAMRFEETGFALKSELEMSENEAENTQP